MAGRHTSTLVRALAAALVGSATIAVVASTPASAVVSSVTGSACGYYVNVGLFGGPPTLRGCGQAANAPAEAASPSVSLPASGSTSPVTATDPDGARGQYGPAVIFGGIWPDTVSSAPPSGPITVQTQGAPSSGAVTSSTAIVLRDPPDPNSPGGIGPGPLIADEAHSTCTATEAGLTASATFVNGILETKYDKDTQEPIVTEPIPANPPPNYTRSGTIDHVGDHFTIVLNEQVIGPDSITVNAAHMYLLGDIARGDMVVGRSVCALSSTLPNGAPVAADDAYSTSKSGVLTVGAPGLLANDTDPDGNQLTAVNAQAVFVPGPDYPAQSTGSTFVFPSDPAHGTASINPDGSFTYTPDGDFSGIDAFQYVARDSRGANQLATVHVDLSGNRAPVALADRYSKLHAVPLNVAAPGVLGNDTDPEGDVLTAGSASDPAGGSVTLNPNGSFSYVPDPGFTGTDTFTYVVSDDSGLNATGQVTITPKPVTAAPVASDDTYSTSEDVSLTLAAPGVLANDTDADSDTLLVSSPTDPPNGSVQLKPNGGLIYTPDANYSGTDTFTYTVSDGSPITDTGQVTITVAAVNDPPVAGDNFYAATEDVPLTVAAPGVLANDTDQEGSGLTAGSASDPPGGSVVLDPNGSFTYTPDADFAGTDTFTYVVEDGAGGADGGLVTITVAGVNDAPVAVDDSYATGSGVALTVAAPAVLANDTDADGDVLGAGSASDPAGGAVSLDAEGSFTYTPDPGFLGTDTFTYAVSDGHGGSDSGLVSITVTPLVTIAVGDVAVTEGDTATRAAVFTVSLTQPSASAVSVDFATVNGGATSGNDYTAKAGTLTFAAGTTAATIKVPVAGDTVDEANETFTVVLSNPAGAPISDASGTATIVDDDPKTVSGIRLTVGDASVHEGDSGARAAVFTVSLSKASTSTVKVSYGTANGTAVKRVDYSRVAGTLSFAPGVTSLTVKVPILADDVIEGDETVALNLSAASGATLTDESGTATILDDDS